MEQATHDNATRAHEELRVAQTQLRGLALILGRCAVSGTPLGALEASALADAMLSTLGIAGHLLTEARREHELSVAQGRLSLSAAAAHRPLRVIAGLDLGAGSAS